MDDAIAPKRQETITAKLRRTPSSKNKLVRSAYVGAMFAQSVNALVELDLYEAMRQPGGAAIATESDTLRMFASGETHYVRSTSISIDTCRELARQTLTGRKIAFDKNRPDDPVITAWIEAFRLVAPIPVVDRAANALDRDFAAKAPLFEADAVDMMRRDNRVGAQLAAAFTDAIDEDGRIAKEIDARLVARLRELSLYADVRVGSKPEPAELEDEELQPDPIAELMPDIASAEQPQLTLDDTTLTPRQRQLQEYARYLGVSEAEAARVIRSQQAQTTQALEVQPSALDESVTGLDTVPVILI
jgi:hypothetical protein